MLTTSGKYLFLTLQYSSAKSRDVFTKSPVFLPNLQVFFGPPPVFSPLGVGRSVIETLINQSQIFRILCE